MESTVLLSVEAAELSVGDELVWHFGPRQNVVSVVEISNSFLLIGLQGKDGGTTARRLRKDRLVTISA